MMPSDRLVTRIRAEFREMPGLRLTFAQACSLWHLEPADCERVLTTLLKQAFLRRTPEGMFICEAGEGRSAPMPRVLEH